MCVNVCECVSVCACVRIFMCLCGRVCTCLRVIVCVCVRVAMGLCEYVFLFDCMWGSVYVWSACARACDSDLHEERTVSRRILFNRVACVKL